MTGFVSRCGALIITAVVISGCGGGGGGGGGAAPPAVDVTGSWSGTWRSSNGVDSGNLSASLMQSGSSVSGSVAFTGSPCFAGGSMSGTVSGDSVHGSMFAGGIRVDLDATVTGTAMNGTYNVASGGACTGDTGTFAITR